jgi:hypothetical protein
MPRLEASAASKYGSQRWQDALFDVVPAAIIADNPVPPERASDDDRSR